MHPSSGFAVHLGPPPAKADEQKSPVAEKFWRFALERVTDKLENPSQHEQSHRIQPETMNEKTGEKNCQRDNNRWDSEGVAQAIDGMLVAACVLRNPLFASAMAWHFRDHTPIELCRKW